MSPADLAEQKRALRRAMRAAREALGRAEHDRASAAAGDRLLALPEFVAARTISTFVPARAEIDVAAAVARRSVAGATILYPRIVADAAPRLRFHAPTVPGDLAPLRPGPFGILEPPADWPEVAAADIELLLVPGLAFDGAGRRLGYGGGYYDEVAALVRAAGRGVLVGVGFDFQLLHTCPAGAGDVAIDWVVTEARTVRCTSNESGSQS